MRNIRDGSMELFEAKNVILATGGNGQVWQPTTNALICTGDGIAMAYRVGAPLMDMEMIQYHPTTLAGKGFLITEGARGEGAHLLNAKGERFMEKYAPNKMELASRDVVSRAEQTEINEGRGFPDGTVALDITVVPRKRIHEALREIVLVGRDFAGVDITREPIHIKPGNHYTMGGVKTDIDGATAIPGLYAAGEFACVSVHGGNRLGANSLLDTLIFGRRSGVHAAERAKRPSSAAPSQAALADEEALIDEIIGRERGSGPPRLGDPPGARRDDGQLRRRLPRRGGHQAGARDRQAAQGGGARPPTSTTAARSSTRTCSGRSSSATCSTTPSAPASARLHRTESRGAQYRTDFPERNDDEWLKHIDLTAERRRARDQLLRRDDHPVAAAGADLLVGSGWPNARSRPTQQYTLQGPPLQARVAARGRTGRSSTSSSTRRSRSSTACCRPRTARTARSRPLLVPGGDLRLLRGEDQRPVDARLPDPDRRGARVRQPRATAARPKPIVVEPMGNMPVIKDLVTDMESTHWKKIRRVTPWLLDDGDPPERERIVPPESMVDITQTIACIQCGACVSSCLSMEADPDFIGPAALAKAYRFVGDPRDVESARAPLRPRPGPARDLRLHPLLLAASTPAQGRRADGPDHAPAPRSPADDEEIDDRNNGHSHEPAFVKIIEKKGTLDESLLLQESYAPGRQGQADPEAGGDQGPARRRSRPRSAASARGKMRSLPKLIPGVHHKLPGDAQDHVKRIYEHAEEHRTELNLYIKGEEDVEPEPDEEELSQPEVTSAPTSPRDDATTEGERCDREARLLARLRLARLHPRAARLDGAGRRAARDRAGRRSTAPTAAAPA